MLSVEINTAIKSHFSSLGSPYSLATIHPLFAYDNTSAPFIVYSEFEGTLSEEQYFVKVSNLIYNIYDNNISRMKDIAYQLDLFMNVGDSVSGIKQALSSPSASYGQSRYRLTSCRKTSGATFPPIEREGFSSQSLNFRAIYINEENAV